MATLKDDGIELGRRIHERFAVEVEAEVSTEAGGAMAAVTRDMSRGGVCFVVDRPLDVGSAFDISLSLVLGENTFSEPLRMSGTVVWCTQTPEGHQIGAAFKTVNAETSEYLQMFLHFLAGGVDVGEEDDEEDDDEGEDEKGLFA